MRHQMNTINLKIVKEDSEPLDRKKERTTKRK